jgi:hypothetical protein
MRYIVFGIIGLAHWAFTEHRSSTVRSVEKEEALAALSNLMDGWFESPPDLVLSPRSLENIGSIPRYYFKDPIGFLEGMHLKHYDIVHTVEWMFQLRLNNIMDENHPHGPILLHIYHTAEDSIRRNYLDLFENLLCTMVDWARFEKRQDVRARILNVAEDLLDCYDRDPLVQGFVDHIRDYAQDRLYGSFSRKIPENNQKFHL